MYKVNWNQLMDGASTVSTAVATMDATLTDINTQMNNLIGTWDAESKEIYLERQKQWNSAADNIKMSLSSFKQGLLNSADHAQGAEKKNVSTLSG